MAKIITFSRTFPAYHPKKGQPTYFVEKIYDSLFKLNPLIEFNPQLPDGFYDSLSHNKFEPKYHTIRAGKRWKVGDKFSPRVWSGKPYNSKMVTIAPDIEIKKVWNIIIDILPNDRMHVSVEGVINTNTEEIAINDGLTLGDFLDWFKQPKVKQFKGQIICWNPNIEY